MVVAMGSAIGDRIVSLRRGKYTQGQLAEYADVGRSWLSQVETGDIPDPGAIRLYRVARLLGVSLDYLVSGAEAEDGVPVYVEPAKAGFFQRWKRLAADRLEALDVLVGTWSSEPPEQEPRGQRAKTRTRDGATGHGAPDAPTVRSERGAPR